MTTFDYYRVTLATFLRQVKIELLHYEKLGYTHEQMAMFAPLATEIHFLQKHYDYLRSLRLSGSPGLSIRRDAAVGAKLLHKLKKYERYKKWIL